MTITEKILAKASGQSFVQAGQNIWVDANILMTHDVCGPGTIAIFKKKFGQDARVFHKDKVVIIPDHYIYTEDKYARRNLKIIRDFAEEQDLTYFYGAFTDKYKGVCHIALAQEGHNIPGTVLFGTDSHTCTSGAFGMFATGIGNTDAAFVMGTGKLWVKVPETMKFIFNGTFPKHIMAKDIILEIIGDYTVAGATYRTMEFAGQAIKELSMEERMTVCNMAIEGGAKNGLIEADEVTESYLKDRVKKDVNYDFFRADDDANYHTLREYDASSMRSVVAKPHSPDNKGYADEMQDVEVDRAYIGSCTGGKITDLKAAAVILEDKKVAIDTFVVPATREVESDMDKVKVNGKTLREIFIKAGCAMTDPSCAACLGGPKDTFARTQGLERVISTTNRNFPGRMGSKKASIYLASPYTVAASALVGRVTDPKEYV
ncbi:3-isopropylmalate dehydratase [PVC group bacterium (ex Bugula neritina AB1)]|nr:3-isopropylmalate dehydratase [PVC group bacterium (ex Bugula neritina AB1)]